jgi:hypothetical protein
LKPYLTDPVEIVLLDANGGQDQFSFTPRDGGEAKAEIASLTAADQAGWKEFWADIQKAAALIYPRYLSPDLTQSEVVELLKKNGLDKIADHIFDGSLIDLLKLYLQNEGLMAVAATCTPALPIWLALSLVAFTMARLKQKANLVPGVKCMVAWVPSLKLLANRLEQMERQFTSVRQ